MRPSCTSARHRSTSPGAPQRTQSWSSRIPTAGCTGNCATRDEVDPPGRRAPRMDAGPRPDGPASVATDARNVGAAPCRARSALFTERSNRGSWASAEQRSAAASIVGEPVPRISAAIGCLYECGGVVHAQEAAVPMFNVLRSLPRGLLSRTGPSPSPLPSSSVHTEEPAGCNGSSIATSRARSSRSSRRLSVSPWFSTYSSRQCATGSRAGARARGRSQPA